VLTEELLGLPALVRELADAQGRAEARLERLEVAVTGLVEAQRRTGERVAVLAETQENMQQRLARLEDVVEVSVGIRREDIERAVRRAGLLGQALGTPEAVVAATAGEYIDPDARSLAVERGSWIILNGRERSQGS
jgi:hypothetical protein